MRLNTDNIPEGANIYLLSLQDTASEDGFTDAPESSSPPPPQARSLTRMSQSTVSSVAGAPPSEVVGFSPVDNRGSQISITPATTANGSVQESMAGQPKSPTSQRRISTSSLDEVSLIDELPPSKDSTISVDNGSPPPPTPSTSIVESITNRFSRSSSSNQSVPTVTKPTPPPRKLSSAFLPANLPQEKQPQPPPAPPTRRSPFSWLRSNTATPSSPPATTQPGSRRATIASKSGSNNDNDKDKEDLEKGMENLRENFKKLREARQQGTEELGEAASASRGSILLAMAMIAKLRVSKAGENSALPTGSSIPPTPSSTKPEDEIDWDLWQAVVDDAFNVASEKPTELNKAIQAGIPPTLRGTVWQSMATSKSLELEAIYRDVIALPGTATSQDARPIFGSHWLWDPSPVSSQASSPKLGGVSSPNLEPKKNGSSDESKWGKTITQLEKIIKRDLGDRTSFGRYKVDQKALLNVCKAYALFDPAVGYTQGMTFIATVLLLNMTEEEAFCLFVKLMNKYKLRAMYQEKMKGLELRLYQYDRILEDYEPRLAIHLKRQNIEASLYAAQWFLTLFAYKFPLQLVLRVFDLLFSEGLEGPILQFGIVLMQRNATAILGLEFDSLGPFLKEKLFDVYIDNTPSANSVMEAGFFGNGGEKEVYRANELVTDACAIKITRDMLDRYEQEWEEFERTKRETELELESLRRNNSNYQNKIKRLEEQNEELNREYVRIASAEVVLKVQNDALADENEVLKTKVDDLTNMVDKQPQEVEDRLRGEMDALMKKNLEVHRENQGLEENMMEMEKQLVSTKMKLATVGILSIMIYHYLTFRQVNEEHDILKNRWNDLKKALGD
ncbi:rab-GTPase-TBC domain-containing protein [Geopyxis carbonaria]|nr:rab-GTPase-TBC domain-containing protein [Geopyxis carbonaria]